MREENPSETRARSIKFSDQNQIPKCSNVKGSSNSSRLRSASSWGSHIVKGLAGDKKAKAQPTVTSKKPPLMGYDLANQKIPFAPAQPRVKRSLIGDLACSVNANQVGKFWKVANFRVMNWILTKASNFLTKIPDKKSLPLAIHILSVRSCRRQYYLAWFLCRPTRIQSWLRLWPLRTLSSSKLTIGDYLTKQAHVCHWIERTWMNGTQHYLSCLVCKKIKKFWRRFHKPPLFGILYDHVCIRVSVLLAVWIQAFLF